MVKKIFTTQESLKVPDGTFVSPVIADSALPGFMREYQSLAEGVILKNSNSLICYHPVVV